MRTHQWSPRTWEAPMLKNVIFVVTVSLVLCFVTDVQAEAHYSDVVDLEGESDFNNIRLHWSYHRVGADFRGFKVTHCEEQAWGPHRCRNVILHMNELTQKQLSNGEVEYSGSVAHLRMATKYTIEVAPLDGGSESEESEQSRSESQEPGRSAAAKARAIDHRPPSFSIQTKGFSARALSCLTNSTQVEVNTGPNFGGKISVEGSQSAECTWQGDTNDSKRTTYQLDINHAACGSTLFEDSVRTYILVQENLPILTHSTRRFMVLCHYLPHAFTVTAGVSLPLPETDDLTPLEPLDNSVNEVDPSELFDSTSNFFTSSLTRAGKALKLAQKEEDPEHPVWAQLVLMVILVVGAVVGLTCAAWHFGRHARVTALFRGGETLDVVPEDASELDGYSDGSIASYDIDVQQQETQQDQQQDQQHEQQQDQQHEQQSPQLQHQLELQQQQQEPLQESQQQLQVQIQQQGEDEEEDKRELQQPEQQHKEQQYKQLNQQLQLKLQQHLVQSLKQQEIEEQQHKQQVQQHLQPIEEQHEINEYKGQVTQVNCNEVKQEITTLQDHKSDSQPPTPLLVSPNTVLPASQTVFSYSNESTNLKECQHQKNSPYGTSINQNLNQNFNQDKNLYAASINANIIQNCDQNPNIFTSSVNQTISQNLDQNLNGNQNQNLNPFRDGYDAGTLAGEETNKDHLYVNVFSDNIMPGKFQDVIVDDVPIYDCDLLNHTAV